MIYLTADLHLGHENIIRYCDRPFVNAHEMNGALIANILTTVQHTDTLYVLGDFAFDPKVYDSYSSALFRVCDVVFLKGNHDPKGRLWTTDLVLEFNHNHRHYYLCHYPWATWRPNTVMLHGHSHGNSLPDPQDSRLRMRFDVGVDAEWGGRRYFPVSIDQVEQRIAGLRAS